MINIPHNFLIMKFTVLIFISITYISVLSQTKYISILDSITKKPIPFCNIYSQQEEFSQHSDLLGKVLPFKHQNDTIMISYTGYKSIIIPASKFIDTIFLSRRTVTLRPVTIRRYTKELKFGNFSYSKNNAMHYWVSSEFLRKIYIDKITNSYKVKSIFIPMKFNSDYQDSCQCNVYLYNNNFENVLNEPIILNSKSISKDFQINIENQHLILSDSILYIGLDCYLSIPNNILQSYFSYDYIKSKSFSKAANKSPLLFYFNTNQMKADKNDGVMLMRTRKKQVDNSTKYKWDYSIFTAGLTISTY